MTDWRLPTREELGEVVTLSGGELAKVDDDDRMEKIDRNWKNALYQEAYEAIGFDSNDYWSSTTVVGREYGAWSVDFYVGYDYSYVKSNSYCSLCRDSVA